MGEVHDFSATAAQNFREIPNCMYRNAIRHILKAYFIFRRHTYEWPPPPLFRQGILKFQAVTQVFATAVP